MEQSFLLKHYGHVDLDEQRSMTAEERNWWLTRIDTEHRREQEASKGHAPTKAPQTPGRPPA